MAHNHDSRLVQTVSGTLERPRYSPGLILQDSDLTAAVDYTRDLNRLMFRSLFGCGVVCGLIATAEEKCGLTVTVTSGLAIASCGDAIHVSRPVSIVIDKPDKQNYWILLRNKSRTCETRAVMCDDDDDDAPSQPTRIKECAEVSLVCELPDCACVHGGLWKKLGKQTDDELESAAKWFLDNPALAAEDAAVECPTCAACGCGCEDYVVIGWVHKYGDEWGVLHHGIRRFVRPVLQADPYLNFAPKAVPVIDKGGDPRQQLELK